MQIFRELAFITLVSYIFSVVVPNQFYWENIILKIELINVCPLNSEITTLGNIYQELLNLIP